MFSMKVIEMSLKYHEIRTFLFYIVTRLLDRNRVMTKIGLYIET